MTQDTLTAFFGWMAVLNIGFLLLTTLAMIVARDWIAGIHARMFALDPRQLPEIYFRYLARYKILTLIFSVVPWLALKLI
jgi:hypothetical protein